MKYIKKKNIKLFKLFCHKKVDGLNPFKTNIIYVLKRTVFFASNDPFSGNIFQCLRGCGNLFS